MHRPGYDETLSPHTANGFWLWPFTWGFSDGKGLRGTRSHPACQSSPHIFLLQMDDGQCVSLGLHHLWNETKIRCISGSKWQNHPEITNHPGAEKQTFGRMSQGFYQGTWLLGGCLDPWQLPHLNSHFSFPACSLKTSKSLMILPSPEQEKAGIANIFMGWERHFPLNSTQMCSPLLCRAD